MNQDPSDIFLKNSIPVDIDIEAEGAQPTKNLTQFIRVSVLSTLLSGLIILKGPDVFEYIDRNIVNTRVTQTLSLPPTSSGGQSDDMVAIEMFLTTAMGLAAENSLGGFSTDIPINYDDDLVELAVKWFFGADPYTRKFILEAALSAMK